MMSASAGVVYQAQQEAMIRERSMGSVGKDVESINSASKEKGVSDADDPRISNKLEEDSTDEPKPHSRFRPYILTGVALVILGWWISATVMKTTRHRWYIV